MTTVTVALAAYNGARYIEEQLASIAAQTRAPDQVVVSDDGSTDATLEIVRRFAAEHPALHVEVLSNTRAKGFNGNFMTAFEAATGDVVMPCDQDDSWRPEKIARTLRHLEEHPSCQVVLHDLELCDEGMAPLGQTTMARVRTFGDVTRYYTVGMAMAVRRPFLVAATDGFQVPDQIYDYHITRRALWLGAKDLMDEVLADYRRSSTSATSGEFLQTTERVSGLTLRLRYVRERLAKFGPGRDLSDIFDAQTEFLAWLDAREGDLMRGGMPAAQIAAARARVGAELDLLGRRLTLRRRPRALRAPGIVRLYAAGGYDQFSGLKAAAKDLALPRLRG